MSTVKERLLSVGFMKYLKNTSWLMSERILRMGVGLFIGVWVARYLGPSDYGLLSYVQSFVGLFAVIAGVGLDGLVVRELVKDEARRDVLLGTSFVLKLVGSFVVLIILGITVQFTSNDTFTNTLVFIVASATIVQSFNVIDFYFQSQVLSRYVVFANIGSLLISSIIKVILLVMHAPLIAFAWIVVFDNLVLVLGFVYFYFHNSLSVLDWKFERNVAYELLKDSWPLILSGMVIAIYMKIDQVMIKEMLGTKSVGEYAVAVKLSTIGYFIPMIVSSSLFPAIINAKKHSEKLYYDRLQKLYDLMVWTGIFIALIITFYGNWLVNILYGAAYLAAAKVLLIHVWTGVFVFLGVASNKWFITENLQKYSFYRTLAGALINVVLNYFLIPVYNIQGAAIATFISQAVASYFFNLFNNKLRYTFLLQTKAFFLPFRIIRGKFE